ncbi:MAG TPA: DegT/DnrJ/EryC1/StrS family aminotransferase [Candidatus Dormibacteraeota bacterium]|nr:DegT/DnrJ/EryC1/StrS family aminotransferase [Candidatus Dormibacteraeota bacterium]
MRIPLSEPDIGEREIDAVIRILRSGRLSLGPAVEEFESRFAAYAGTRYAVATSSGTAALHLCVKALGIGAGDEAITSSFSFVASANCLLYENARPVFADIDSLSLNLDPVAVREIIQRDYFRDAHTKRLVNRSSGRALKAILPVHIFGLPCDMEPILTTAREYGLHVIEDACEALGAEHRGRRVGGFGDAAVFAFYPNKQITSGEGGMIVTDNAHIENLCRSLRNQGRANDGGWLLHTHLGYNYRLSELHCALGLAQLDRIDEFLARRNRVAQLYSEALAHLPQFDLPREFPDGKRSWFTYVIQLRGRYAASRRNSLMSGLHARGIDCRPYFPAIHRQPYFHKIESIPEGALPHTESAAERCLALPFFPSMTDEQVDEVCTAIREVLHELNLREFEFSERSAMQQTAAMAEKGAGM